jgi:hypothetical protein
VPTARIQRSPEVCARPGKGMAPGSSPATTRDSLCSVVYDAPGTPLTGDFGVDYEGETFNQEDVREVSDHPQARPRLGDLREPAPQAETGLT